VDHFRETLNRIEEAHMLISLLW